MLFHPINFAQKSENTVYEIHTLIIEIYKASSKFVFLSKGENSSYIFPATPGMLFHHINLA